METPSTSEKRRVSLYAPQGCEKSTDDEFEGDDRLTLLNNILERSGKGIITRVLTVPWKNAGERTKMYYIQEIQNVMEVVTSIVCPNDSEEVWKEVQNLSCTQSKMHASFPSDFLQVLVETYKQSGNKETRRQLLSIVADKMKFADIKSLLPNLTAYEFSMARLHEMKFGRGMREPIQTNVPRDRVAPEKLDHFLDFVTSSHVIQDLPFGMKKVKLSSGEVLDIPNVIRLLAPTHLVQQYHQYCEETQFSSPLQKSTLMKILSEACLASIRKCLQGLDYYVADGGKAFDDLQEVVNQLLAVKAVTPAKAEDFKTLLKEGKQYIKTEFKVSI